MFNKTFKGGVHPNDFKTYSDNQQIKKTDLPSNVIISLSQHVGAIATPIVNEGDYVKTGQKIAEASGLISINMHASISGTISKIDDFLHPRGVYIKGIKIESDSEDNWVDLVEEDNFLDLPIEEMKARIFEAGICGMGGAGFPTNVKISPHKDYVIDTLIVSGVECEPYLTADNRLMIERPDDILNGIRILMKILNAKKCIIGIESNKPKAIKIMKKTVKNDGNINVVTLQFKYPQGGEKQLIYATTKRRVLSGQLPCSVGVIVNNVATVLSVFEAVKYKKPLIEKVITVSGRIVNQPSNLAVRIGTSFTDILNFCDNTKEPIEKAIVGGPMMGYTVHSLDIPVIKTASGLTLLAKDEVKNYQEHNCIRCGRCIDVCPNGLMPSFIATAMKYNDIDEARKAGIVDCMKCGCCSFVCPAHIRFNQYIELGKLMV